MADLASSLLKEVPTSSTDLINILIHASILSSMTLLIFASYHFPFKLLLYIPNFFLIWYRSSAFFDDKLEWVILNYYQITFLLCCSLVLCLYLRKTIYSLYLHSHKIKFLHIADMFFFEKIIFTLCNTSFLLNLRSIPCSIYL